MTSKALPLWVRGDIDGFFGLFIDNLMQLIVILALCTGLCGMSAHFVLSVVFPGAAVSVLAGNLFYAFQARRVARFSGAAETTALPYGINTVSLFAFVLFIMHPVYQNATAAGLDQGAASLAAWSMGCAACFFSGVIECAGAFVAEWVRRHTPRAALLSTLSGIAIAFIAMDFALRIFSHPLVGLLPLGILLAQYFGRITLPFKIPGGLVAITAGTILAWAPGTGFMHWEPAHTGLYLPRLAISPLFSAITGPGIWGYFSVILPMALFNVIGSLQNIESAEASGDSFNARTSLTVNGLGSMAASLFGSCFPTTIYIGHPGWKALGARSGYSIINGAAITLLCVFGLMGLISALIPVEAGAAIVFWIGIVITAQAFQAVPRSHAPAVAMGIFPAIAAWGLMLVEQALGAGGFTLEQFLGSGAYARTGLSGIMGLIAIERGFMFTCMILAAVSVFLIDQKLYHAALWCLVAAALSFFGIIHAHTFSGGALAYRIGLNAAPGFSLAYVCLALLFLGLGVYWKNGGVSRT